MPDAGHDDKPAVRHRLGHRTKIGRRDPAVPLAPQHQMRMPDLRHATLQLPALFFTGEVDGRPHPDAFRDAKGLLDDAIEQRRDISEPVTESRNLAWRHA